MTTKRIPSDTWPAESGAWPYESDEALEGFTDEELRDLKRVDEVRRAIQRPPTLPRFKRR